MLDLNLSKKPKKETKQKEAGEKSAPIVRPFWLILFLFVVIVVFVYIYILPSYLEQKQDFSDLVPKAEIDSVALKEALARQETEKEKEVVQKPEDKPEPKTEKPKPPVTEKPRETRTITAPALTYESSIISFSETIKTFLQVRSAVKTNDFYGLISVSKNEVNAEIKTTSGNNLSDYKNIYGRDFSIKSSGEDRDPENRYVFTFSSGTRMETVATDQMNFRRYFSPKVLIDNLKENAMQNNLSVERIRERRSTTIGSFKITPVVFKTSGRESGILEFLETIRNLNWNINVRKLSATSLISGSGNLDAQLIIDFDVLSK